MIQQEIGSRTWASCAILGILFLALGVAGDESARAVTDAQPLRVLFIGNSQTFHNKVYQLVEGLSRTTGVERPVVAKRITRGGETFQRHTERRDAEAPLRVIAEGGWDFVILQENSHVLLEQGLASFPFAARLVRAAREAGATPIFYMTWAYRPHPEDQERITELHHLIAARLGVRVAPVGEAFRLGRRNLPAIELLDHDGIHASFEGSYLAACVLYAALYDRNPEGAPLTLGPDPGSGTILDPETVTALQRLAWRTWRGYRQPTASPP